MEGTARLLAANRNIADFKRRAERRLPSPLWHYLEGGADDEWTLARNTSVFDEVALVPDVLVDVSQIDPSATVLGQRQPLPLVLSPTGMSQLFHADGEMAVARAAAAEGLLYGLLEPWRRLRCRGRGRRRADRACSSSTGFGDRVVDGILCSNARGQASGLRLRSASPSTPIRGRKPRARPCHRHDHAAAADGQKPCSISPGTRAGSPRPCSADRSIFCAMSSATHHR